MSVETQTLRSALIGTKNSLASAAALLEQLGASDNAASCRRDVEVAEAALEGGWAVLNLMRARDAA